MESGRDSAYRLKLAEGFLKEAKEDFQLNRWRSCVDNSQLAAENSARAVISVLMPVPKRHDVTNLLPRYNG